MGGGYTNDVFFPTDSSDLMFAHVDVGGAFRSADGGETWRMIHGGLPDIVNVTKCRGIHVDPRNPDILLYAAGWRWSPAMGIYRSTDGGDSWFLVQEAQFYGNEDYRTAGRIFAHDPADPDVIIAGSAGTGLFRSTDNGLNWSLVDGFEDTHPTALGFDPLVPSRVWLSAVSWTPPFLDELAGGFWRSDDAGETWTKLAANGPDEFVILDGQLYGLFENGTEVRKSVNGSSWSAWQNGLSLSSEWLQNSAALAVAGDAIITATQQGVFYRRAPNDPVWEEIITTTVDAGDWWGNLPGDQGWIHYGKALNVIAVDPNDPKHWFFADWYGIWETDDSGKSFRLKAEGLENTVLHVLRQDPSNPQRVHLGMGDLGYFRSEDSGRSWDILTNGYINNVKEIALSPLQPDLLYAVATTSGTQHANEVFYSTNAGNNFITTTAGLPGPEHVYNSVTADPSQAGVAYVAANGPSGGVYKTTDGGFSWSPMSAGLAEPAEFFINSIWESGSQLAASGDGSLVAISNTQIPHRFGPESGAWVAVDSPPEGSLLSVWADTLLPGRYFITGSSGTYRSLDSGKTWTKVHGAAGRHVITDSVKPDRVLVGSSWGVYLSLDAGDTWRLLRDGIPVRGNLAVSFAGDLILGGSLGNGVFWRPLPLNVLYADWAQENAPDGARAMTDAPAGDGISNVVKFAAQLDATSQASWDALMSTEKALATEMTFHFTLGKRTRDLNPVIPEWSGDLENWSSEGIDLEMISEDTTHEFWKARLDPSQGQMFFRIRYLSQ